MSSPAAPAPTIVEPLLPLFKWTGGKRREIARFEDYYPSFTSGDDYTFVEPFVGGGAVLFSLGAPRNVVNDLDLDLVTFYRVMARQDARFLRAVRKVSALFDTKPLDRDAAAAAYYKWRDLDRDPGLDALPDWKRAARFFILTQLAFSGMRRFNSSGHFNVPFGHYKNFNDSALRSQPHVDLLQRTDVRCGSYEQVLDDHDEPDTFIFLDPPYTRVMKTYTNLGTFGEEAQRELARRLRALEHASFMLVIDRSELTEELYGDMVVHSYALNYNVNIKNRFGAQSEHIVVCNYTPPGAAQPALAGLGPTP